MISAKSQREIETMRQAGKIVALAREAVAAAIRPGVTTKQLDRIAEKVIRDLGASPSFKGYGGFPASICTSVNSVLVHGIPDQTVLKDGDIISIDIGACFQGYHGDAAWTYAVGNGNKVGNLIQPVVEQNAQNRHYKADYSIHRIGQRYRQNSADQHVSYDAASDGRDYGEKAYPVIVQLFFDGHSSAGHGKSCRADPFHHRNKIHFNLHAYAAQPLLFSARRGP